MIKGILYGVGVGPGDPELMTLKAQRIISECPVLAVPKTKGQNNMALDIVSQVMDISGKEIIELDFLMIRDREQLARHHRALADLLAPVLDAGKSIALLNIGDVSIFATYSYIRDEVASRGYETVSVAGVPSFCAVAATLGVSLTKANLPLHIIPAGYSCTADALDLPGSKVLMKAGSTLATLKETLRQKDLSGQTSLVENCGLETQAVYHQIEDAPDDTGYFATIVVRP